MKLFLDDFFQRQWLGKDPFAEVENLDGKVFRNIKNRRTLKFSLDGKSFFLKHHRGVGWREIFKNLFSLKLPVIGAGNEFRAIRKLEALQIKTMHCSAYGERGFNPAARDSFIITEDIGEHRSLEEIAVRRQQLSLQNHPPQPHGPAHRQRIVKNTGERQSLSPVIFSRIWAVCGFRRWMPV